ncbi:MAG: AAA family ATPase [SAR202 cluster bacterium]|nr:AAA family ATPase [SAR202 cluster bacterium]
MESLGNILKRLTVNATSKSTSNGGGSYPEPKDDGGDECPVCNGLGWVSHKAPRGHPDFGQVFPCRCQREKTAPQRQEMLQRFSGLSEEMLSRMTFEGFEVNAPGADAEERSTLQHALIAAKSFASDAQGWLLLTGPNGCGKTHLSVAISGERIRLGQMVFFTMVPDLLDHLRSTFNPNSPVEYDQLFEMVKTVPLLILDDMGAESSTAWAQEKMFQITVHRHNHRLPMVITTNLSMEQMEKAQPRLASRLKDVTLVNWLPLAAPDRRDSQKGGRASEQKRQPRGR